MHRFLTVCLFSALMCSSGTAWAKDGKAQGPKAKVAPVAKGNEKRQEKIEKREAKIETREAKAARKAPKAVERPVATTGVQAPMRFRGLDRNRNGRISRDEWRGNDVSFRVHDWNQDGVLSGDEVRPGARPPSGFDERIVRLDRNNDRLISRSEWGENVQIFERLDANHDGVLSAAEFARR